MSWRKKFLILVLALAVLLFATGWWLDRTIGEL